MIGRNLERVSMLAVLGALVLSTGIVAKAQCGQTGNKAKAKTGKKTAVAVKTSLAPTLTATLVDAEKKAREKTATVEVKVTRLKLIDPALVHEKARAGQGHLHYRVDNGPVIATTATKLSFHELSSGKHTITVMLAANDHNPIGPQRSLEVTIP